MTRNTRALLTLGAIAGPLYVVVSLAQAFTREGFDPTRHAWSILANGELGWIQSVNLIVSGLLVVAGAIGVRGALRGSTGGIWAPRLLAVYGVSLVVAGIFRADPGRGFPVGTPETTEVSWHGMLHFAAGGIGFPCLVAACFVLAGRFAADGASGWAAAARGVGAVFGIASLGLFGGGGSSWSLVLFSVAIMVASGWLAAVLLYLRGHVPEPSLTTRSSGSDDHHMRSARVDG